MERRLALEILKEGANIYSERYMRGFSDWAKDYPCVNGEAKFIGFYVEEIKDLNSRGASRRLYDICDDVQAEIFGKYFSSLRGN